MYIFIMLFMYFDDIYYVLMMFGRMHTRKWDPRTLFPNGIGWRALLIVRVQYKKWDLEIVFSPIDFKFLGKQIVWDMDSQINKVILIGLLQQQACWFLYKIFMESQRLKVASSVATSKNHT